MTAIKETGTAIIKTRSEFCDKKVKRQMNLCVFIRDKPRIKIERVSTVMERLLFHAILSSGLLSLNFFSMLKYFETKSSTVLVSRFRNSAIEADIIQSIDHYFYNEY